MQETYETWVQSLGQGEFPGEGHGNPLQYSCLENPMGRGTWWAIVQGVAKSQTGFSIHTENNVAACTEAGQQRMLDSVVRSSDYILKELYRFKLENSMERFL